MNVMTLYHGSNQIIQSPHLLKIQRALDFQLCRGTKSMRKNVYFAIDYYDRHIIQRIIDKYNLAPMDATRSFILSKTHAMLEDAEYGLLAFPEYAVFDMWEAERVTGDPQELRVREG